MQGYLTVTAHSISILARVATPLYSARRVRFCEENTTPRPMGNEFVTEAFTLLSIAVVIIAVRTVARWTAAGPRNFQLDDYLILLAAVGGKRPFIPFTSRRNLHCTQENGF